jgi:hypothetical protein
MGWPDRPGSRQPPSQPPSLQATSQETPQASPQTVSPGSLFSAECRAPLSRSFTGERYYSSETNHRSHCSRACDSCRNRKIKCSGEYSGCGKCNATNGICTYSDGKREINKSFSYKCTADREEKSQFMDRWNYSICSGNNISVEEQDTRAWLAVWTPTYIHVDFRPYQNRKTLEQSTKRDQQPKNKVSIKWLPRGL